MSDVAKNIVSSLIIHKVGDEITDRPRIVVPEFPSKTETTQETKRSRKTSDQISSASTNGKKVFLSKPEQGVEEKGKNRRNKDSSRNKDDEEDVSITTLVATIDQYGAGKLKKLNTIVALEETRKEPVSVNLANGKNATKPIPITRKSVEQASEYVEHVPKTDKYDTPPNYLVPSAKNTSEGALLPTGFGRKIDRLVATMSVVGRNYEYVKNKENPELEQTFIDYEENVEKKGKKPKFKIDPATNFFIAHNVKKPWVNKFNTRTDVFFTEYPLIIAVKKGLKKHMKKNIDAYYGEDTGETAEIVEKLRYANKLDRSNPFQPHHVKIIDAWITPPRKKPEQKNKKNNKKKTSVSVYALKQPLLVGGTDLLLQPKVIGNMGGEAECQVINPVNTFRQVFVQSQKAHTDYEETGVMICEIKKTPQLSMDKDQLRIYGENAEKELVVDNTVPYVAMSKTFPRAVVTLKNIEKLVKTLGEENNGQGKKSKAKKKNPLLGKPLVNTSLTSNEEDGILVADKKLLNTKKVIDGKKALIAMVYDGSKEKIEKIRLLLQGQATTKQTDTNKTSKKTKQKTRSSKKTEEGIDEEIMEIVKAIL